ncbi:glycoside hydrolase family 3 C-terminal domain-containing protein [Rugosimonospora acidiphila]|uniref:glycoside hydrolase family 3 C-terminal domain-containing protein n=1 Tax=Rugosimonospora acidiphila TaxID=556531 RepID=UPI0031E73C47
MSWRYLTARIAIVPMVVCLCTVAPLMAASTNAVRAAPRTPIYLDPSYSFAERAADLVARLTPAQRASQLVSSQAPAITSAQNPLLTGYFGNSMTTLAGPTSPGDTSVVLGSVAGIAAGTKLTIGPVSKPESVTVSSVGTAARTATTLVAAAAPGDTAVKVASVANLVAGERIRLDAAGGANQEFTSIQAVGTAGADGTGVTLGSPLTRSHASGVAAQDLGSGVAFSPALSKGYGYGAAVTVLIQGVPAYGWWNEALHGINAESLNPSGNAATLTDTTSYPIDLSRASSWDPALTYQVAQAESDEAREIVRQNRLDLDFYSPTVNLARDPRWGRNDESYGEDPLLEAQVAGQFVNGMEGKDQNGDLLPGGDGFYKTTTTLKHYAMNNTEGTSNADPNGRLNGSSNADERTIREYYTMPFRKIVQDDQNGAVMSSYNEINGVPSAANTFLNDTLMRETFGFQGYFTGDCDAVNEVSKRHQWQPDGAGHPVTDVEQFAYTLGSGEDAECNAGYTDGTGSSYRGPTSPSTTAGGAMNALGMQITTPTGLTTVNDLDVSATRLFTNRMKLGEFDPNSKVPWLTQAVARDQSYGVYPWNNATAPTETSARLDLARESADASLVLLKNSATTRKDGSTGKLLPMSVPASGSFKVLVLGSYANNSNFYLGGYSSIQNAAGQANEVTPYAGIKAAIQAVNPSAQVDYLKGFTGTGTNAGNCCTAIDPAAVAAAADYDYVIVYAGMDSTSSNGTTGTEDRDRSSLALPGLQGQLISQVSAVNPDTIGVMETIGAQDVSSFESTTPAILWSSFNGMRKGDALADVLLGKYNPSGRTPETWYQSVNQLPSTSSYTLRPVGPNGRTYMYFNGPVSYPFGYGLSYTNFDFSNLRISDRTPNADGTINVSVDVKNTGSRDGNEVVQLYVNTPNADPSLERPIKRLEGFQKVSVPAGHTKRVTLPIKIADLAFYNEKDQRFEVDPGAYGIQLSTSSADSDIQAQGTINVKGALTPKPSVLTAQPRIMTTDDARGISQRVMFPEGVTIDPGLTVAMNDDSLSGWIAPGQSKSFPAGMTFSYSSDRPQVVSVDHNGKIRTVANGAATVTATVRYKGKSASTSFVVRVLSDLNGLKVNGQQLAGFNPDVTDYDVVVPNGVSAAPQISATGSTGKVSITQATSVPGVATVTSTGPDGIVAKYQINFARQGSSDEFDSSTLGSQWHWVREAPADWSLSTNPGSLTITPKTGDLTTTTNTAQNILLQPALGDWTQTTKLAFNHRPNAATQQGGIIAYQDDDNYLKFDLEATSPTNIQFNTALEDNLNGVQVTQTLNTLNANAILPADNTIWLRMSKSGAHYSTSYSLDGTTWVPVWTTGATLNNPQVGLFAFNRAGATTDLQVGFDSFHVDASPPAPTSGPRTTASLAPHANSAGWNRAAPTVTLTGTDRSNWGLASTEYNLDGGGWQTYSAPVTVTGDGVHTLMYRSTDNAGNVEPANTLTVRVDTATPQVAYTGNSGSYAIDQAVQIHCAATDPGGSGVAKTTCADLRGPAYTFGLGTHRYGATATDTAGNTGTGSTGFTVTVTYPSVEHLVREFSTRPSVASDLNDELNAAAASTGKKARDHLSAFINQVHAQTGKALTANQAKVLTQSAQALE